VAVGTTPTALPQYPRQRSRVLVENRGASTVWVAHTKEKAVAGLCHAVEPQTAREFYGSELWGVCAVAQTGASGDVTVVTEAG
jgi:hypothetical protein